MKRKTSILLGIGTVLSLSAAGAVWLVNTAVGVVDDTVDTTISAAGAVEKIVQNEPPPAAKIRPSQDQKRDADAARQPEPASKKEQAATQTPPLAMAAPGPSVVSKSDAAKDHSSKSGDEMGKLAETNVLAAIEQNVGSLLGDDADDAMDVSALTKALRDDSSDDDWLALIPGGKSPTLKGLMAGKYAGKEDQAVEDAIGDPQAWRLVSFFGGLW